MKKILPVYFCLSISLTHCASDPIRDRPISFSQWRVQETIRYINERYDRKITSLEMLPVMVVVHYTAMDSLDVSFDYLNKEEMESGRGLLKKAGGANIAVQFLVGKKGEIYRLMPENHIGRHVIGLNRHAIGIENVGAGAASLTPEQVKANEYIVRSLVKKFPIRYLIAHSEYRSFESTPLWEERDNAYRTEKFDPGEKFMTALRASVADLGLKSVYDGGEIPDRLNHLLSGYNRAAEFNGSALVYHRGKVIFRKSYGSADLAAKQALTPEDRVYLASAAKSLTAVAVAALIQTRKLSYDAPVAQFFPGLKNLLQNVRVKHLLSHTSGLEDYYKLRTATPGYTNADVLAALALQKKPLGKPGKKFHYANSNYVLLAEIVAQVTRKPFQDFLREKIFTPAGMQQTLFKSELAPQKNAVIALAPDGKPFEYPFMTTGPGGVYSTLDDVLQFDRALMSGKLVQATAFRQMVAAQAHVEDRQVDYGHGWYTVPERKIAYHDGNFSGYHTMNWLQLGDQTAIILLANRATKRTKEITYEIDRILNGASAVPLR